jgi:hypothetical protein
MKPEEKYSGENNENTEQKPKTSMVTHPINLDFGHFLISGGRAA